MPLSIFKPEYAPITSWVIGLRKKAGLSQRTLASRLGRERSFVARVETGQRRLDLLEIIWLCDACGATVEEEILHVLRALRAASVKRRMS
jgi:transcriptional regulator with XRE-family HTH domain